MIHSAACVGAWSSSQQFMFDKMLQQIWIAVEKLLVVSWGWIGSQVLLCAAFGHGLVVDFTVLS